MLVRDVLVVLCVCFVSNVFIWRPMRGWLMNNELQKVAVSLEVVFPYWHGGADRNHEAL